MSNVDPKLQAFPAWEMGQVLLPVQFQTLQAALLSQMAARAELSGLPGHGLARLHLREGVLAGEGAVSVNRLTYFFRAPGLVLDVPGNTVISDLSVSIDDLRRDAQVDSRGRPVVSVYLHLLNEVRDARGLRRYLDDDVSLTREIHRAQLSLNPSEDDARASVKLLELGHEVASGWSLASYSPALLRVGSESTPFLAEVLERIQLSVRLIQGQVARDIAEDLLTREHASELRRVRSSCARVLNDLEDLGVGDAHVGQVSVHPYQLFRALRDFYFDAASDLEHEPAEVGAYDHGDLSGCFERLHMRISSLRRTAAMNSNAVEFELVGEYYEARELPAKLREASEVYLIIKSSTGERPRIEDIKLASGAELQRLLTYSLPGIPLRLMDETTSRIFTPKYGNDARCCELDVRHEEWLTAMAHGDLSIPVRRGLEVLRLFIVWPADTREPDLGERSERRR